MAQICYYGDRLSPNMAKTPEGFLICRNVPIARTGYQEYLESELVEDGDPTEIVSVYRSPKEVFDRATLASFEGKPVTNGHPSVDVSLKNYSRLARGHVQHVRMGTGPDADKIVADLYITDPELIDEIKNGKRQVSAGYYALDVRDGLGRICQTKIRGNHVAVVDEGRAGGTVCIRDEKNGGLMTRKQKVAALIAEHLRNASASDVMKRFRDAAEVLEEEIAKDEAPEEEITDGCTKDEDGDVWEAIRSIDARLEALESKFNSRNDEDINVESDFESADEPSEEVDVDVEDEDVNADVDVEDEDVDVDVIDGDEVSARDSSFRKSQITGLMKTVARNKSKRDAAAKSIDVEAMQAIYDRLNPHKGGK